MSLRCGVHQQLVKKQRPPRGLFCLKLDNSCCYARYSCGNNCNVVLKLVQKCNFIVIHRVCSTIIIKKQQALWYKSLLPSALADGLAEVDPYFILFDERTSLLEWEECVTAANTVCAEPPVSLPLLSLTRTGHIYCMTWLWPRIYDPGLNDDPTSVTLPDK